MTKIATPNMPTRRDILILAHLYWQQAGSPPAEEVSPDEFWLRAERDATPIIVLAIANKLLEFGILRLAGDIFYPDFYYDKDFQPPALYAYGKLDDNGIYTVQVFNVGNARFDLNKEKDLTKLIEHLVAQRKSHRSTKQEQQQEEAEAKRLFTEMSIDTRFSESVTMVGNNRHWNNNVS